MRSPTIPRRWVLAGLAVFAVLFAPADWWPVESSPAPSPVDPRILAPTVREAVVGKSSSFQPRHREIAEERTRAESNPPVASTTAALLATIVAAGGLLGWIGPRLILLRSLAPRGPPELDPA